jgi:hypothetical protein
MEPIIRYFVGCGLIALIIYGGHLAFTANAQLTWGIIAAWIGFAGLSLMARIPAFYPTHKPGDEEWRSPMT